MMFFRACLVALMALPAVAQEGRFDLDVLLSCDPGETVRRRAFKEFLERHFRKVTVRDHAPKGPADPSSHDVVVVDWKQNKHMDRAPLGDRARWNKPAVLIGSAGLNLSKSWRIRGGWG